MKRPFITKIPTVMFHRIMAIMLVGLVISLTLFVVRRRHVIRGVTRPANERVNLKNIRIKPVEGINDDDIYYPSTFSSMLWTVDMFGSSTTTESSPLLKDTVNDNGKGEEELTTVKKTTSAPPSAKKVNKNSLQNGKKDESIKQENATEDIKTPSNSIVSGKSADTGTESGGVANKRQMGVSKKSGKPEKKNEYQQADNDAQDKRISNNSDDSERSTATDTKKVSKSQGVASKSQKGGSKEGAALEKKVKSEILKPTMVTSNSTKGIVKTKKNN